MIDKLQTGLAKTISLIPGVAGFANLDFSKSNLELNEDSWDKSIILQKTKTEKISMSVAVIVEKEMNAKTVVSEINSSILSFFKKTTYNINDLNIYIRGIK